MDEPSSPEGNAITLRIKFKSASLDEFVARYGADVSAGGIFIRTKQPLAVGTTLHFDFTLGDGSPLVAGMGTVVWVREADASRVGSVPGMGVRFDQLTPEGQQTHQQILVVKAKRQERTGGAPVPSSLAAPAPRTSTPPAPAFRMATPAPPAAPVAPAPAAPIAPAPKRDDLSDDFGSGGKTEIADRPPSFYFEAQGGKAADASAAKPVPGAAVPTEPLDDAVTNSQQVQGSGAPSQPVDLGDFSGGVSAPVELLSADSMANELSGPSSASITDLPLAIDALAAPASAAAGSVPLTVGKESSWLDDALKATSEDAAVPEVAANEPTQETSVAPETMAASARASHDETAAVAVRDERAVQGDLSVAPAERRVQRAGKSGKGLIIVGSVAAVLAFAGVYLWMAKPWENRATVVPAMPAVPNETVPAAQPIAAEPAQVAEPVKPAEPAKPAEVVAVEQPVVPAAEPAKVEAASESGKRGAGAGKKTAAAPAPVPASAETAKPAPATGADLVYMLKIKTVPPGARITMDGDPMGTSPFQRRVLDIDKPHSILVQKPGYDSYERTLNKADFGPPSGNTSTLSISAKLTRLKAEPAAAPAPAPAPAASEEQAAPAQEPEKL